MSKRNNIAYPWDGRLQHVTKEITLNQVLQSMKHEVNYYQDALEFHSMMLNHTWEKQCMRMIKGLVEKEE